MNQDKICVIGAGYVGLALALELGIYFNTLCIDLDKDKIDALKNNIDITGEFSQEKMLESKYISFDLTDNVKDKFDYVFITVGTPIDSNNKPDLSAIINATKFASNLISRGSVVIYESTVYPGTTEEICIPLLTKHSLLSYPDDFNVAYSPERINPGDKTRPINKIVKIISADSSNCLDRIKKIYDTIITAGTYSAESIKVAEAAKLIENTQRDLNIALINEFSIVFEKMKIPTNQVLNAASTKWNFINLKPGLVGGHCISVDPYYLTYKSEKLGYIPTLIHAGRTINEFMPIFISNQIDYNIINGSEIVLMGFTFKNDCSDIRNTKVFDLYNELVRRGFTVTVYDPLCSPERVLNEYGVICLNKLDILLDKFDAIIYCVNHKALNDEVFPYLNNICMLTGQVFFDIPNSFNEFTNNKFFKYLSL